MQVDDNRWKWQSYGIAAVRMIVGIVFLVHGCQKLFVFGIPGVAGAFAKMGIPAPGLSAFLATMAEFLGGAALLAGLFTRLAAIPVAFNMLVAILAVHLKNGFFLPTGFEYALTMLVANCALMMTGPGAFALDNLRSRTHRRTATSGPGMEGARAA
jgi:putative oxidoreductase